MKNNKLSANESLVLNIDHSDNEGTHWTCLFVKNGASYYFDSFGFPPPLEVINYCKTGERFYNTFRVQKSDEVICGHYCIYMLLKLSKGFKFYHVLNELVA